MLVSSTDHSHTLYQLDKILKEEPKTFTGHKSSLYIRSTMSPCSKYIISGSSDHQMCIWDTEAKNSDEPVVRLENGHHGEVRIIGSE